MDPTQKRNKRIFSFLSALAIIYIAMILLFSFVNPAVAREFFHLHNLENGFTTSLLFAWDNVFATIDHVYPGALKLFLLTTLFLSLYAWFVLSKGKNIIEVFLLFIVYLIPKPEEYWGKVQNKVTTNVLPFTVVRIVRSKSGGGQEFVAETISDLFGRYRLNINIEHGYDYYFIINAQDYKPFTKKLSDREAGLITIYDDIFLEPLEQHLSSYKKFLNAVKTHMNKNISTYLYLASLLSLLVTVRSFLLYNAPLGNYVELTQYIVAVVINSWRIFTLRNNTVGRVMLYNKKQVLPNIKFQLKQNGQVLEKKSSDANGTVTFNVKPGSYELVLLETHYELVNSDSNMKSTIEVVISEKGLLQNNIILKQIGPAENFNPKFSLLNPFQ